MFKNSKFVGVTLVSGFLLNSCSLIANADKKEKIRLPFINYASKGIDIVPKDVDNAVGDACFYFEKGYILEANSSKEKAESLVRKYNLDIFLPWQDLTPYEALFDLSYCEDLDEQYSYICSVKSIPKEMERIIDEENWYTNKIADMRSDLRKGVFEEGLEYDKRKLVILFKERELVRKKLAVCISDHGIKLEKHFGQEENTNSGSKVENTGSDDVKEENIGGASESSNKEEQSLVSANAVSKNSWGLLDIIIFAIRDKVNLLLDLKAGKEEFVSKEVDLRREAKRQETEFSLSLLVKRFLDFVRGENSMKNQDKSCESEDQSESTKNEDNSASLLELGFSNLLIEESTNSNLV